MMEVLLTAGKLQRSGFELRLEGVEEGREALRVCFLQRPRARGEPIHSLGQQVIALALCRQGLCSNVTPVVPEDGYHP